MITKIAIIVGIILLYLFMTRESFAQVDTKYLNPEIFVDQQPEFLVKIPYDDDLSTRHYKKRYYNRNIPECVLNQTCPDSPTGFFKSHLNYYQDRIKLKNEALGYSIEGIPYADYSFNHPKQPTTLNQYLTNKIPDLKEPEYQYDYPTWFDYSPQRSPKYYGYPYGGKIQN